MINMLNPFQLQGSLGSQAEGHTWPFTERHKGTVHTADPDHVSLLWLQASPDSPSSA